ncbi:class I SAM-dependent methyltransferase [Candidatus Uhrbacteria bacterium]|jgi:precorrin-6B methylase 2|nr:class I SAM-dependent methyltransferase [Candidatus Uhrbacteria bacterium]
MIKTIILAFLWAVIATAAWAGWSAAPWVPSKTKYRRLFLGRIPINEGDTVYDLGCGTGTVLIDVLEKYPNTKAIGVEISIIPYLVAKFRSLTRPNMQVRYGNLFRTNLADADVVFIYLLEKAYPKLLKKLRGELKPTSLLVLEAWPFKGIEPWKIIKEQDTLPINLYRGEDLQ